MNINEKYSFKDFTGKSFIDVDPAEFNDSIIKGSNFYQELEYGVKTDKRPIFPASMRGVTFERCNLDNVMVVANNIVSDDCTNKSIQVQNDLEDWVLDNSGKPAEPISKKRYIKLGISVDPKDIPRKKMAESRAFKTEMEIAE